jgi:hypothetical protein
MELNPLVPLHRIFYIQAQNPAFHLCRSSLSPKVGYSKAGCDADAESVRRLTLQPNGPLHLDGNPLWLVSIDTPFCSCCSYCYARLGLGIYGGQGHKKSLNESGFLSFKED